MGRPTNGQLISCVSIKFSLGEPGNRIFIVVDNSLNVCVVPDDDQDSKDDMDDFDNLELWCMQIYNEITTAEIMLESDTILPRDEYDERKTTRGRKKYRGLLPATANRSNR